MVLPLYDDFRDYDQFVNWEARLAYELPFVEGQLAASGARRVLDAACGTGRHAIALATRGYEVAGADLSAGMIERARANAAADGLAGLDFIVAGFGQLASRAGTGFDAVMCLGNSLPHVLTSEDLQAALRDFAALLRPGGLLLVQNRNFDAILADRSRWMPLQARQEGGHEWLFLRFYDFAGDGTLTFNVVTLWREDPGPWSQRVRQTTLRPWLRDELVGAAETAGFDRIACYGDMSGAPFADSSGNLVLSARRTG